MKRFLALAALVLGMVSCQQDVDTIAPVGGEVDFQLAVAAPELVGTRAGENGEADTQNAMDSAFGAIDYLQGAPTNDDRLDWENDADLRYTLEVYDTATSYAGATPVKDRQVVIVDKYQPVVFDLRLVPGRNYHFVVFADFVAEGSAEKTPSEQLGVDGLRHKIGTTLADIEVVEVDGKELNDEIGDAYFATKDITISNSAAQDIVLKRPYGKVRVIATDLAELNLNVHPKSVEVVYESFNPKNFNAVTGDIDGELAKTSYTTTFVDDVRDNMTNHVYNAGYDAKTSEAVNGTVRNSHITLFTDYILGQNALADGTYPQTPIHFTMTVNDGKGGEIKTTAFTTDIPVERNKLTTVIGNVLTTATEIEVRIDDNFAGENVINATFINTAAELQKALDNYENGQTIILGADIKGNVTVNQVEGKDYVIDGNGYNYDGTIYVDGNARNNGAETVTIRNFNFATDSSDINFIEQNSTDSAVRYPHNVTIENCSFLATGENVAAVKIRQGYNITIKDCVADGVTRASTSGMHSLGQFYGCTGITIDGVEFNADRGVSFGTSLNVVVKNSTFVAKYYGLRADASVATTLKLENVNITANLPVIARNCSADYAIELTGENTMEAPGYHIIFTKGDDEEAFVAPSSNFSVTGAEEFNVFPGDKMYAYNVESLQYFLDNAVNGDTIELAADIEGDVTVTQKADVKITIEGHDHKYAGVITVDGKSATYKSAGVTIKNLNFEAETISADACVRLGAGNNNTRYTCNVAVEGCTFAVPGAVAVKSYTGGDHNLSIKNCTGTGIHSLTQLANVTGVTIEGVNVTGGRGASFGQSSNIVVKNSTFVAESYGLRVDAKSEATLAIENVNITAKLPVIARKTSKNYTINFTGVNNLNTAGYQVVFTTGDDEDTFVAPAAYTLTGADNFKVFPRDAEDNNFIYNVDEFKKALEAKKTTIILQPGEYEGEFTINYDDVTIKGDEATIKGRVEAINATAKFEGIKFDFNDSSLKEFSSNIVGNPKGHPAIVGVYGGTADAVTFEGCEFICKSGYSTATAPGAITHYGGIKLTLKECTIDCEGNPIYAKTNIEMTGCTVKMYGNNAVLSLNYSNEGRTVIFKNNIVENKSTNGAKTYGMQFLSTNGKAYKDMYFDVQGNTVDVLFSHGSGYTFANATYANGSATL